MIDAGIGAVAGLVIGAGAYALAGQDLSPPMRAAIVGGVSLLAGAAVTSLNPAAGAGLAGGGGAIAGLQLLSHYMTEQQTSAIRARVGGRVVQMAGARAPAPPRQIGAVRAPIGPNQWAMLNGVYPQG